MAIQRTFSIIKPDATRRNLTGAINAKLEAAGLRIVAQKRIHLTLAQAQAFYGVHKDRPFFGELTEFIYWNNPRMLQLPADLCFLDKPLHDLRLVLMLIEQHLDRQIATQVSWSAFENLIHVL